MKTSFGAMTGRERLCFVLKYLFMALCVVVALFPIIWVILSSFKTNAEILSNGISLPTHFGFDGYRSARRADSCGRHHYRGCGYEPHPFVR